MTARPASVAALLVAAAWARASAAGGPRAVPVLVNAEPKASFVLIYFAHQRGYFRDEGVDVRFAPIPSGRAEDKLNALANGSMDVAVTAYNTAMNKALPAAGFKIVADGSRRSAGKPALNYFLVRADLAGTVRGFADLRGRTVALLAPGSFPHFDLLRGLERAGLRAEDATITFAPETALSARFAGGAFDVASVREPAAGALAARGVGRVFAGSDAAPSSGHVTLLAYSRRFMADKPRAERFMLAYVRAARDLQSARPEELAEVMEKSLGVRVDSALLSRFQVDRDAGVDVPSLMADQAFAKERGLVAKELARDELVDLSFLEKALRTLASRRKAAGSASE